MRRMLAAAALAAGAAAALLPVAPASAVCITPLYEATGHCSPCFLVPQLVCVD
ncbi:MAG TPA: hypothetical protein VFQ85_03505 [Mycobacteriales bacterium]|jgi:hypothetical protein|nr:hypothetical protein [Mycobacteriales bacterium]